MSPLPPPRAEKPKIVPLAPEEREMIEQAGSAMDEAEGGRPPSVSVNRDSIVRASAENRGDLAAGFLAQFDARLLALERLLTLNYAAVTILLDRFGVTDPQFVEVVQSTVAAIRGAQRQPATPEGAAAPAKGERSE